VIHLRDASSYSHLEIEEFDVEALRFRPVQMLR
jgi:hypothetical protein